ncbi:MAG: histidine kinase [Desulfobacteraceae bacterium]|nr:histidine kinase [Desulfobacteraceae bacterium]
MQWNIGLSLRTRLYLLVLAAFIPVGALIFFTAEEQQRAEKESILQGALMLARAAAMEEQEQLDTTRNLLMAMGDLFLASQGDPALISSFISHQRRRFGGYADMGVIRTDGRLLISTLETLRQTDFSQSRWFEACVRTKTWALGEYGEDRINGQPVLRVAVPVINDHREILAVAFAALDLDWMNRTTFKMLSELPTAARLTLIDDQGGLLRYDAASKEWSAPGSLPEAIGREIMTRHTGIEIAADRTGIAWIYAFAPLESPLKKRRVYVSLELPAKTALSASHELFVRNMVVLSFFALMAVMAVWWAADLFILRRLQRLVNASQGLAVGDLNARVGDIGGRDELTHLASVFDEMAQAIQTRQAREQAALEALRQSQEQLRNLSVHQQQVREEERIRIARELHDEFGQSLTILKMDLSWIKKRLPADQSAAVERIHTMFQLIDASLKTLHSVMAQLRPVILDDFGLAAAIEWQAEEFQNRTGIACQVEITGSPGPLAKAQEVVVFRIFQELLTNIIRHAQAKLVQITLEIKEGRLRLRVADDGRGITAAEIHNPGSYGLLGIRERLHPWNGTMTFEGRAGQGTQVLIELPVEAQERK